jgi:hypothetical protein
LVYLLYPNDPIVKSDYIYYFDTAVAEQ